jgi:hypothetical protein
VSKAADSWQPVVLDEGNASSGLAFFPSEDDAGTLLCDRTGAERATLRSALSEFPSEGDLRASDPAEEQLPSADEAANAFLSEGVQPADTKGANPSSFVKRFAVAARPTMSQRMAVAFVTFAAGVLLSTSVISRFMTPSAAKQSTDARADVADSRSVIAAPLAPSRNASADLLFTPASETPPAAVAAQLLPQAGDTLALQGREARTVVNPSAPAARDATSEPTEGQTRQHTAENLIAPISPAEPVATSAAPVPESVAAPRLAEATPVVADRVDIADSRPAAAPAIERPGAPVTSPANTAPVRELLARYRAAYEALDARLAKEIWPTVDERALSRAFDGLDSQRVTFDACDVAVTDGRAVASCRGSASYVTRVGNRSVYMPGRQWGFEMQKSAERWVIASVQTR